MLSNSPKQMVAPSLLAATATKIYEVTTGIKYTIMREISLNNTDTVTRTFTLHIVPSGGSASATNMIFDAVPIQAAGAEPLNYSRATVLKPGDMIYALADSASKVSIMISGIEYT